MKAYRYEAAAKVLLENNANIEAKDNDGKTALMKNLRYDSQGYLVFSSPPQSQKIISEMYVL